MWIKEEHSGKKNNTYPQCLFLGAAGLTPGQLRKKQWKQKMSARSQSFGSNKCFKCGQEGHWANKCKSE